MTNELRIGRQYEDPDGIILWVDYILMRRDFTWCMVYEKRGKSTTRYLSQIPNEFITVCEGFVILEGHDLVGMLRQGYVLGTIYERLQPKYYEIKPPKDRAV